MTKIESVMLDGEASGLSQQLHLST